MRQSVEEILDIRPFSLPERRLAPLRKSLLKLHSGEIELTDFTSKIVNLSRSYAIRDKKLADGSNKITVNSDCTDKRQNNHAAGDMPSSGFEMFWSI